MLLFVLTLCFLSEITLFAIFDKAEAFVVLATNINQQNTVRLQQTQIKKHNLFSKKHQTTLPPQISIKQARFYKPCIYDKKLGFNKPAVVIRDGLFVDSGICVLTVVCAICATPVQSRVSEQTHSKSPTLAHKKHLSKIIVFTIRQRKIIRPQTTRINIIRILHPFTSKIIIMPTLNNTNLGFPSCF